VPKLSKQPPHPPTAPKLQNGEKGADIHTVSESDRIRYSKVRKSTFQNDWWDASLPQSLRTEI
jgi:hypothetical protein